MASGVYNFKNTGTQRSACEQGATFSFVITYKDNSGRVIDLTGFTARMQVRETKDASTTILSLTNGSGTAITGSLGQITLSISAADTANLTAGDYYYDLELDNGSGGVTRLLEGEFQVTREVTR